MKSPFVNSRRVELFIKCMYTYIIIFLLVLALVFAMYSHIESTIRDTLRESYQHRLDIISNAMESAISRASTSAALIAENHAIRSLSHATADSVKSNVTNMRTAKDHLEKMYTQLDDDFISVFILYPENDYLVTNKFITHNYKNEYGVRFSFDSLSAEEWKKTILDNVNLYPTLLASMRYRSSDLYISELDALSFIVPFSMHQYKSQPAMVFCMNAEWCRERLKPEDGVLFSILDSNNTLLAGDAFENEAKDSLILTSDSSAAPFFHVTLTIPQQLISQKMSAVNQYIKMYIISALAGILILSAYFALRHFSSIRKIAAISPSVPTRKYASPYHYAVDIVESLSQMRDTLSQKLLLMESTYTNNLLVNVCQRGIASNEDFAACEELLSDYRSGYCVIVVRINPQSSASLAFIEAETGFLAQTKALAVRTLPTENIYIAGVNQTQTLQQLQKITQSCFDNFGLIGISRLLTDIRRLHEGYQLAYALTGQINSESQSPAGSKARAAEAASCLDMASLLKLQDYIHAANSEQVESFFTELEIKSRDLIGTEQFHIFFVLRQMLMRVGSIIPGETQIMPGYIYGESAHDCFERLKKLALSVVENARTHNLSGIDAITSSVFSLIENNFGDPNMSADYLAERLNCSAKYVYQKVKEHTNKTLGDVIEEHRMNYASELLISTDKKIEEIAHLCGYTTPNTFYRTFRKHYSVTPGEWRRIRSAERYPE